MYRFGAVIWPIIAVAFPLLELLGIIGLWHYLGYWTLAWLLLAVMAGVALVAVERLAFLPGLAASVLSGSSPLGVLKASGLRFLAAALLIFPGPFSDAVALLLLLWAGIRPSPPGKPPGGGGGSGDVLEGEYRRLD